MDMETVSWIAKLVYWGLFTYIIIHIVAVLFTWIDADPYNTLVIKIDRITRPMWDWTASRLPYSLQMYSAYFSILILLFAQESCPGIILSIGSAGLGRITIGTMGVNIILYILVGVISVVMSFLWLVFFLAIIWFIITLVNPPMNKPIVRIVMALIDPLITPLQKRLPRTQVDWSPVILTGIAFVLNQFVFQSLIYLLLGQVVLQGAAPFNAMTVLDNFVRYLAFDSKEDEDFLFLDPGGDKYQCQLIYPVFPEEYLELDRWDRNNLWLSDLGLSIDEEFSLNDDGKFAVLSSQSKEAKCKFRTMIDLTYDYIWVVYYLGEQKTLQRFNRKLTALDCLFPLLLSSEWLIKISHILDSVQQITFEFNELPCVKRSPTSMKGNIKGPPAFGIFRDLSCNRKQEFNLTNIEGIIPNSLEATINIDSRGFMEIQPGRLSSALKVIESIKGGLIEENEYILENHIISLVNDDFHKSVFLKGEPIETRWEKCIENMEGLITILISGDKTLGFTGTSIRLSRKLWRLFCTDIKTGNPIELEISNNMLRIFIKKESSIPLMNKIVSFLQGRIDASIRGPSV